MHKSWGERVEDLDRNSEQEKTVRRVCVGGGASSMVTPSFSSIHLCIQTAQRHHSQVSPVSFVLNFSQ